MKTFLSYADTRKSPKLLSESPFSISTALKKRSWAMFSDHLKEVGNIPCQALLGVVAVLAFIGQLVALVLVMNGQVEKAHFRDAQYNSTQMPVASCSENQAGAAHRECIEQANVVLNPYSAETNEPDNRAVTRLAGQNNRSLQASHLKGSMKATLVSSH